MTDPLWFTLGALGSVLFFGRFYVQWLASEWQGRYVVPVSFWYMSAAGSLLLFAYAYQRQSPGGTFGLCFNLVIYARNLVFVWREQGTHTRAKAIIVYTLTACVTGFAVVLTAKTWHEGYAPTSEFWVWSLVWVLGQGIFFGRFAIQWMVTELQGRSVIPASFWQLSLLGLVLHGAYFLHRGDWLLAGGTIADGLPYARNLWLMKKEKALSGQEL